jgi:hypothetical protein
LGLELLRDDADPGAGGWWLHAASCGGEAPSRLLAVNGLQTTVSIGLICKSFFVVPLRREATNLALLERPVLLSAFEIRRARGGIGVDEKVWSS